jgi:hypothetical protein
MAQLLAVTPMPASERSRIRRLKESQSWLDYHGPAAVEQVVISCPRVCPKFIREHAMKMRAIHDFPAEIKRFDEFNWCLKS